MAPTDLGILDQRCQHVELIDHLAGMIHPLMLFPELNECRYGQEIGKQQEKKSNEIATSDFPGEVEFHKPEQCCFSCRY
jgi:hypothetical protein